MKQDKKRKITRVAVFGVFLLIAALFLFLEERIVQATGINGLVLAVSILFATLIAVLLARRAKLV